MRGRLARNSVLLAIVALPPLVYWRAAIGQVAFYFGDIYRLHHPQRSVYAECLRAGHLPWWSPHVLGGYPLVAEGQMGPFYPLNLILYGTLPLEMAINYSILLHLMMAGAFMYLLGRRLGLLPAASAMAGIAYMFSGFLIAHISHLNILAAAAWLPLIFVLLSALVEDEETSAARQTLYVLALATVYGLQFLAGHPQISLISVLASAAYLAYAAVATWMDDGPPPRAAILRRLLAPMLAIGLGIAMASAQLLPTYELSQLSARAGGLDPAYFTSFSLHPLFLVMLLLPFAAGDPYPQVSVEVIGYLGILPLLGAALALLLRRDRRTFFFALLAAGSLGLALGQWNPLYSRFAAVPVFNLFRVPARFLFTFTFAMAALAGIGFDALGRRLLRSSQPPVGWRLPLASVAALGIAIALVSFLSPSISKLVTLWQFLPWILLLLGIWMIVMGYRQIIAWSNLRWMLMSVLVLDLYAFGLVLNFSYNASTNPAALADTPRSVELLRQDESIFRTYTTEDITPVWEVAKESLFPNVSLRYRISSANGYFPLVPRWTSRYLDDLSPRLLDLLNVKYILIPQVLPITEEDEFLDVNDPFAPSLVGRTVELQGIKVAQVEVWSFISHSVDLPTGQEVARIIVTDDRGVDAVFPLRAGIETAEWAYDRGDVREKVRHSKPEEVRQWPARSGYPPEDHPGYTYRAILDVRRADGSPTRVSKVRIESFIPKAFLWVDQMVLIGSEGGRTPLADFLEDRGNHTLVYRSEDVAIYRNHDVMPRAFLAHRSQVIPDDRLALSVLRSPNFDSRHEVILNEGQEMRGDIPRHSQARITQYGAGSLVVETASPQESYLVLGDAFYPGWKAYVDGVQTDVYRANVMFRAIRLPAGQHRVEMRYTPTFKSLGRWISLGTAMLVLAGVGWSLAQMKRGSPDLQDSPN